MVESVRSEALPPTGARGLVITGSAVTGARTALVSADTATCGDCLAEMRDPADRRYRYPFVNCTNCGPRYTIVRDVPYDRATTTMAGFTMCAPCAAEYHDPADRRFHAQPTCCPDCGPTLVLEPGGPGDPVREAAARLRDGAVLAVKGLGGYHLAVRADDADAVARLRAAKHREEKPFAVMAGSLDDARALVEVGPGAAEALGSRRAPIVLLPRRPGAAVAPAVAPGNRDLGVMLPYTPLHHLLAAELGVPFVLTSGNASDEPIAHVDDDARTRLAGLADGFLTHDRPIHVRTDDSVVRLHRGAELPVRRARGYAPEPVPLAFDVGRPVLGCGAEVKNAICLAAGRRAFLSPHLGDLTNPAALRSFHEATGHLGRLFGITPLVLAHDLHPDYLATRYALDRADAEPDLETVGVQHHHAHVAACLAEHGATPDDPRCSASPTTARGSARTAPSGAASCCSPVSRATVASGTWPRSRCPAGRPPSASPGGWPRPTSATSESAVRDRHADRWDAVVALARSGTASPPTSSVGRLFDAVSALLGVRDTVTYEGQAAIELEQRVDPDERGTYPVTAGDVLAGGELVAAVVEDLAAGVATGRIAARFHHGLADATVAAVARLAGEHGVGTAALSGGVFVNAVLLERVRAGLEAAGLRVLVPTRVPCTDGGIALGQVAVCAARM